MEAISAICNLADTLEACVLDGRRTTMIEERLDHAVGALLSIKRQLASPPADRGATSNGGLHENFPELVRRVLLTDQGIRLHAFADGVNLSYLALHARMLGHVPFFPAEIRQLFRMFPDPRLADYLLAGTAYMAILRPAIVEARVDCSLIRTGLLSMREMVQFLEGLLLTDDTLGAALPATVECHLDEAVRQLATLQWNLTYIGRRAARPTPAVPIRMCGAA